MDNKNDWNANISKFKNESSQILYLIYYLYDINEINKDQKLFLKNLVLLKNDSIFISLKNLKKTKNINNFLISMKKLFTDDSINNTRIEDSFRENNRSKHLITISNNSWNDENNNEENILDDLKSPVNHIKKINKKK